MTISEIWRELHRTRFPDLPLDCGNVRNPGVTYSEDLSDWSNKAKTPDQARMERYIDQYDLADARILHIGIGNSSLAKRFHARAREIVGTTIDQPEMQVAHNLALPDYRFVIHNKYSGQNDVVEGRFDYILDNNPTSPCCCIRHLSNMIEFYDEKLAPNGQIVTDQEGLGWVPDGTNPRWKFGFDDLVAVGAAARLSAFRITRTVYVLSRSTPAVPSLRAQSASWLRRARSLPAKIVRNGPRVLVREGRRLAKRILRGPARGR